MENLRHFTQVTLVICLFIIYFVNRCECTENVSVLITNTTIFLKIHYAAKLAIALGWSSGPTAKTVWPPWFAVMDHVGLRQAKVHKDYATVK